MPDIITTTYAAPHKTSIHQVRDLVFCQEQGVDPEMEYDGLDEHSIHVVAYDESRPVATGRIQKDGHIGRIAVIKDYRKSGIGAQIVTALIAHARNSGLNRVFLGAQIVAIPFYTKLGFTEYGEPFLDADIEHIHMEKQLNTEFTQRPMK